MIEKDLEFVSFFNFYKNRKIIRKKYRRMTYTQKFFYKMYVYSTPFEKEDVKDLMWDYLNVTWNNLIYVDIELMQKYDKRKKVTV